MIRLTKLNDEEFIVNCNQIECIEAIPESKVILMNRDYYIVTETPEEIVDKIIAYNAKINLVQRQIITVKENDK